MTGPERPRRPERRAEPSVDLLELYRPDISDLLIDSRLPRFRRTQVLEHLMRRTGDPFASATSLPLDIRRSLDLLGSCTLTSRDSLSSADGATKLLLGTRDDMAVEAVIMRYRDRITACVSSQVGCPVGCTFCATGALGFTRNLTAAEIVDQVRMAGATASDEGRRLSNLVFMGMGEPLLNLQSVLDSIRIITDPEGLGMAHRALSVSTIGIPAGIRRLGRAEPQVNLAISLHAADDATRALLVPETFRHTLSEILRAAWDHFENTRRKLLIEYVLIGGVNDSPDDARRLAALLRGHVVAVNLLAWNPVQTGSRAAAAARGPAVSVHAGYQEPTRQAISTFRNTLLAARIETVVRQSKGTAIQAACGQLAARAQSYSQRKR